MTLVVFWNGMWDQPIPQAPSMPQRCAFSADRALLEQADAVVFHLPSLDGASLSEALRRRRPGQAWVAWSMECDLHHPHQADPAVQAWFDLRMTYRLDSDIPCTSVPADAPDRFCSGAAPFVDFDRREAVLANAFISSRVDRSGRGALLLALMERMSVASYGALARNRPLAAEDDGESFKLATQSRYKFSLAFENACQHDYVTEKFFQPLLVGSVPVVLGAPNVDAFAPSENSYVDVRDFDSVDSLVTFLAAMAADRSRYEQFHAWRCQPLRPRFLALARTEAQNPWVRLCRFLQGRSRCVL